MVLPINLLIKRLTNEEEELRKSSKVIRFSREDHYKGEEGEKLNIYTVIGWEYGLETVRIYEIEFNAPGYYKPKSSPDPILLSSHVVKIYVLRWYPYYDDSRRLGAPVRLSWVTPIFHPNIAPGPKFGGNGAVCWNLLKNSMTKISLLSIIEGLTVLISNPYPDDPIAIPEICKEAAKYFKERRPPIVMR